MMNQCLFMNSGGGAEYEILCYPALRWLPRGQALKHWIELWAKVSLL
jgi:hypothetical protein